MPEINKILKKLALLKEKVYIISRLRVSKETILEAASGIVSFFPWLKTYGKLVKVWIKLIKS